MTIHNQDIRKILKEKNICIAHVATELGMYDSNFIRMLRLPVKADRKATIIAAIEKLSQEAK